LIAIKKNRFNQTKWPIKIIKHPNHKILSVIIEFDDQLAIILHNTYAPCDKQENKNTLEELAMHKVEVTKEITNPNKRIQHIILGDLNSTLKARDLNSSNAIQKGKISGNTEGLNRFLGSSLEEVSTGPGRTEPRQTHLQIVN